MADATGGLTVAIPVYDDVDMLDVTGPWEMMSWAGITPVLLAEKAGPVQFRAGFTFDVPTCFADAAPRYDALWVPGGDPNALAAIIAQPDGPYLSFLRAQAEDARYVCSVCEGALLLAAAGLLDGYRATTHWAFIPCLLTGYPKVTVAPGYPRFVHDGNRLTGGGISSGLDEALKLIELLTDRATAESAQQTTQYYPDPPVSSAIPQTITCPVRGIG
ncbi:MAG: DJ-1/PfpI family protein [Alphaproteobacteria bacterium]|nr:DJ-1/PfpI family protein [Alphaproteobacteria bacterium]